MKRKFKKTIKVTFFIAKLGTGLFFGVICLLIVLAAGISMQDGFYDEKLINQVGMLSIMMGIFPTLQQLLKMILNEKFEFTVTGKCPHCKVSYEMTMIEKSDKLSS